MELKAKKRKDHQENPFSSKLYGLIPIWEAADRPVQQQTAGVKLLLFQLETRSAVFHTDN